MQKYPRNKIVKEFLKSDHEYLIFFDDYYQMMGKTRKENNEQIPKKQ